MKTIAKVLFVLMLVGLLIGGFDAAPVSTVGTSDDGAGLQLGVISSVSAEDGLCEDGRPGCKTSY
jgi:hypothetical protein